MEKITLRLVYGYIIVFFIIISIYAYMIYKHGGFYGYLENRKKRRDKLLERTKNLFNFT
jgi:hypothetical protein